MTREILLKKVHFGRILVNPDRTSMLLFDPDTESGRGLNGDAAKEVREHNDKAREEWRELRDWLSFEHMFGAGLYQTGLRVKVEVLDDEAVGKNYRTERPGWRFTEWNPYIRDEEELNGGEDTCPHCPAFPLAELFRTGNAWKAMRNEYRCKQGHTWAHEYAITRFMAPR